MATYLDGTEPPRVVPKYCPSCGERVSLRWYGNTVARGYMSYFSFVALPVFACDKCKVAFRMHPFPRGPLHETRKEARAYEEKRMRPVQKLMDAGDKERAYVTFRKIRKSS